MVSVRFLVVGALGLIGCAFEPRGGAVGDDGAVAGDAAPGDGGEPDAAASDAAVSDAAAIDAAAIDAAAVDAPVDAPVVVCPTGYTVVAGASRFRFVTGVQVVSNANADCGNDGPATHLATFEDPADVPTVLAGRGGSEQFWVAATCASSPQVDCSDAARWRWPPDNEAVTAALWASGEPNNGAVERNAVLVKEMGDWRLNNVVGTESHAYICECGD